MAERDERAAAHLVEQAVGHDDVPHAARDAGHARERVRVAPAAPHDERRVQVEARARQPGAARERAGAQRARVGVQVVDDVLDELGRVGARGAAGGARGGGGGWGR